MKKIALIGSTGSIGRQVINVCERYPHLFNIVALVTGSKSPIFDEQIKKLNVKYHALSSNLDEALAICRLSDVDIVFVACSGFFGLCYTLEALKAKKQVALANKESLVCGGELVMPYVENNNLVPVDSEHSAIWQCLNFDCNKPLSKIYLTASGGAFRDKKLNELKNVTLEEALCHPNWKMGKKITVDCATLLNKGFEVIEAHHLYNIDFENIEVLLHPSSIVHSMVEFCDGAMLAQLGMPTMELPIQMALTYPKRLNTNAEKLKFPLDLHFEKLEKGRYPIFDLAVECGKKKGTAPTILNASSEIAVDAFLNKKIGFLRMCDVISYTLDSVQQDVATIQNILQADEKARMVAKKFLLAR